MVGWSNPMTYKALDCAIWTSKFESYLAWSLPNARWSVSYIAVCPWSIERRRQRRNSFLPLLCCTVVSNDKNPPEIKIKNWVIWLIILMHSTVWKVLDLQMQSQETIIMQICWNLLEKIVKSHCQVNLFLADFSSLEPLCSTKCASTAVHLNSV